MQIAVANLVAGWLSIFGGVVAGAVLGLFFHHETWLGGYTSFRRRLARLGHISFFGLGFINLAFALSVQSVMVASPYLRLASLSLLVAAVTMPLCCFLTVWHSAFRHLFPFPVISVLIGLLSLFVGWQAP